MPRPSDMQLQIHGKLLQCWNAEQDRRPSFEDLVSFFSKPIPEDFNILDRIITGFQDLTPEEKVAVIAIPGILILGGMLVLLHSLN